MNPSDRKAQQCNLTRAPTPGTVVRFRHHAWIWPFPRIEWSVARSTSVDEREAKWIVVSVQPTDCGSPWVTVASRQGLLVVVAEDVIAIRRKSVQR